MVKGVNPSYAPCQPARVGSAKNRPPIAAAFIKIMRAQKRKPHKDANPIKAQIFILKASAT